MFGRKKSSLLDILPKVRGKYKVDEPLSKHTWFGVGGPAEVMYFPEDIEDLADFIKKRPYNLPIFLIGSGSNILVRDGGIPGVVIKLSANSFRNWKLQSTSIKCGAGLKNSELKKIMLDNNIGGLEFLVSIPGSLGGAVKTNAGCFGKELKDVLLSAIVINENGEELEVGADNFNFGYRCSFFPEDWIVVSMTLKIIPQERAITAQIIDEQKNYRLKTQPINAKTAGSTFKNPDGLRAWELIKNTQSNLLKFNDAEVSDKHCNFLINTGSATAQDIENLGEAIIKQVKQETGITLEWEVKRVGVKNK